LSPATWRVDSGGLAKAKLAVENYRSLPLLAHAARNGSPGG
jgi:hypothetical protein